MQGRGNLNVYVCSAMIPPSEHIQPWRQSSTTELVFRLTLTIISGCLAAIRLLAPQHPTCSCNAVVPLAVRSYPDKLSPSCPAIYASPVFDTGDICQKAITH